MKTVRRFPLARVCLKPLGHLSTDGDTAQTPMIASAFGNPTHFVGYARVCRTLREHAASFGNILAMTRSHGSRAVHCNNVGYAAQPSVYKTAALPTELQGLAARFLRFCDGHVKRLAVGLALSRYVRGVTV